MKGVEVGVVGGGLMGIGIAVKFALAGQSVVIVETDKGRVDRMLAVAGEIVDELMDAGAITADVGRSALEALTVSPDLDALGRAALVIEAVPEILDVKRRLFERIEAIVDADSIIASNTSGYLPDRLSEGMRSKERFLIAHFWNPPHLIPLVEVVPGTATDRAVVEQLVACLSEIDAQPVVLNMAIPGFIGNRIQFAVLREALNIVRAGVATPEVVDTVVKASLGRRYNIVGPLEGADLGGLATFLSISQHLMPELAKDEDVLDLLRQHTDRGELGLSSGQGFYRWTDERLLAIRSARRRLLQTTN
ncbi:3-hydroxyacyl-CoA dehydrogenase family protein [Burkholderia sp. PU8-34]